MRVFLSSSIFIFFICFSTQATILSKEAKLSLLTCSPGEELYAIFGHSAIRVQDPMQKLDIVYNYGTFDFNTPNFYLKFMQGQLDYALSVAPYERFELSYQYEKRSIYEQELLLDSLQRQQLFDALQENRKEENRYYQYDFFMDNCATRIDELIRKHIDGDWKENLPLKKLSPTYRTSIYPYIYQSKWIFLGLNIILGAPTDQKITGLFLPDILKDSYARTTVNGQPIVGNVQTLYEANHQFGGTPFMLQPLFLGVLLSLLVIGITIRRFKQHPWVDFLVFFAAGAVGLIVFFLWFLADHVATNHNFNILWAFPLHFFVSFFLFRKKKSNWLHYYFSAKALVLSLLLISCLFPPILFLILKSIPLGFPVLPLTLILIIMLCRAISIAFRYRTSKSTK